LAVFTGLKSPYHKPEDDADLIDYEGMALITEHMLNVVRTVSQSPDFRPSGKLASKHKPNRTFRWGLTLLGGTNYHHYTAGAVNGKPALSFAAGLSSQINMGQHFALRPELLYERIQAHHPAGKVSTDHLTLPLSFAIQTPSSSPFGAAVYLGGYYSYRFGGSVNKRALNFEHEVKRDEGGYQYGLELRLAQIKIGFTQRYELTNFSRNQNQDGAHLRNHRTYATLSYLF
ncbi:MAG: outer membrane beta-barrel protein, partial [Tannerellaceae bacterium]|nr:outer membrane beta-barrel protein [Tannerellaceae bacterium]